MQPCPWLEPERAAGQALFFKELKEKWPTVLLSLYVSGAPDVRITAQGALPSAGRAYPFGYSAEQVQPMAPHLDQVRQPRDLTCWTDHPYCARSATFVPSSLRIQSSTLRPTDSSEHRAGRLSTAATPR